MDNKSIYQTTNHTYIEDTEGNTAVNVNLAEYYFLAKILAGTGAVMIIFGVVGNILCIAVLSEGKITSTRTYLINLACSDLLCILVGLLGRIFPKALLDYDTTSYHPIACKMWRFLNGSMTTISSYTLVAVTMERLLVVYLPLKAKTLCTKAKARVTIVIIDVTSCCLFLHLFWSYGAVYTELGDGSKVLVSYCNIARDNPSLFWFATNAQPWIELVLRSLLPFCWLLVTNCLIVAKLHMETVRRRSLSTRTPLPHDDRHARSMTAMLLTVSFVHLVCVCPYQLMYVLDRIDPYGRQLVDAHQVRQAIRWGFAISLYYLNNSCNFILYCISGSEFRRSLRSLCRKCRRKKHQQTSSALDSTRQETTEDADTHI